MDMSYYVPEFKISINGVKDDIIRNHVLSVQIEEELQTPTKFSLVMMDEFDVAKNQFKWLDHKSLQPGNKIKITLGYVDHQVPLLPEGEIKTITTSGFSQSDAPKITIIGYDLTHSWLTKSPEVPDDTTSIDINGSDVVNKIASESSMSVNIDSTTEYPTRVTKQSNSTYGAILKDRAKSIGYEFFVSRGTFYYINPRSRSTPKKTYEWGKHLIDFAPSLNTADLVTGVKVTSMPNDSKNKVEGEAQTGTEDTLESGQKPSQVASKIHGPRVKEINDGNFASPEEATTKAKAELNIIGDVLVTGNGSVVGAPDLEIGQVIELNKLGPKFSGKYFVTKLTNGISGSGYITKFGVRKNVIGS